MAGPSGPPGILGADEVTSAPGLDLDRLGPWLAAHLDDVGPHLTARRIAGGRSNLTYEVGDGRTSWIVRRPPLGHVLATAHDMAREHLVMSALAPTAVPVPKSYAHCADDTVLGAPFTVMEFVAGTPYRRADELRPLGPMRTRALSHRFVEVLAALHAVEPAAVGLADFGRPQGFLTRQVARWKKQLDASYCRDLPAATELHRRLLDAVGAVEAAGTRPAVVHGDYRLDNVLVVEEDGTDRIAAVLDWELATLGDPLTDLALLVLYQRMAGWGIGGDDRNDACLAPGWPAEDELLATYASAAGRDLGPFGFHLGLAAFKLAAILEGIYFRHLHGGTVGDGFDSLADDIHPLLETGLTAMRG